MDRPQLLHHLSALPRRDLMDILMCLMDSEVLSLRDLFDLYERKVYLKNKALQDKVAEAEGHVFEMLYPCLYDTDKLSRTSKDIIGKAIDFVAKEGKHSTQGIVDKFKSKEDSL